MSKLEPWDTAVDPEGWHTEMLKAKYYGCICDWQWKYTGHRSGYDKINYNPYCQYHKAEKK